MLCENIKHVSLHKIVLYDVLNQNKSTGRNKFKSNIENSTCWDIILITINLNLCKQRNFLNQRFLTKYLMQVLSLLVSII
jgi:tRNA uridine 5-carbamoylmethylation protein Kti12